MSDTAAPKVSAPRAMEEAYQPLGRGPSGDNARMSDGTMPPGRVELEIESLQTKTFPISRRGYDRAEVDAYLRAVADNYQQVLRRARDAIRAAQQAAPQPEPPPPSTQSFDEIGGRVAAVLSSAAQAAEDIKAEAQEDAEAERQRAHEESLLIRQAAADELVQAERAKETTEKETTALAAAAKVEAARVIAAAREAAERIEAEAERSAATLERTTRANMDAAIAEARREYQHLRSIQQQCVDRLAAVEFLARQAREGLAEAALQSIDDRL